MPCSLRLSGQSSSQKIRAGGKEEIRRFCSTKGGEGPPGYDPHAGDFRGSEGISEQMTFKCMQEAFLCRVCVCVCTRLHLLHWGCQRAEHKERSRARGVLTSSLVVVHADSLQLQVTVAMVTASGVDAVLIADDFPKLEIEKEARDGLAS